MHIDIGTALQLLITLFMGLMLFILNNLNASVKTLRQEMKDFVSKEMCQTHRDHMEHIYAELKTVSKQHEQKDKRATS